MKPLERLSEYLGAVERRLRLLAFTRGAALTAAAALALTVVAVLVANHYSFSNGSVLGARLLLFTGVALALAAALIIPVIRLNRRGAARQAEPRHVARSSWIFSFSSAAVIAAGVLIWLGTTPGFLGYGTSLLWGGLPKGVLKPFYAIQVDPGNRTVRKRADQLISATLSGFSAPKVRFFAKYSSASQWEQAEMRTAPGG